MALSVTGIDVENVTFSPSVKAPGSTKTFYLRGAGVRELDAGGKSVKTGAIGVYLEDNAVPMLAAKWKGKTAEELTDSVELFRDIVTGPFQKFTRVTALLPFAGGKYAENVAEQCVAILKSLGTYTEAEAKAIDKFLEVFKAQSFAPGASFLFTHSPLGSLTISFSKDGSIPEAGSAVIENKPLSEAVLESIIGENGVSPTTKKSLAERLPECINK